MHGAQTLCDHPSNISGQPQLPSAQAPKVIIHSLTPSLLTQGVKVAGHLGYDCGTQLSSTAPVPGPVR